MAHYARLAMEATEYTSNQADFLLRKYAEPLVYRLEELQMLLDELEAVRPHSPADPLFDRYFYRDFGDASIPYTVQELLLSISEIKEQLLLRDIQWLEEQHLLTSIRNTGADQHGQVVFAAVFLPECARCA